MAKMWGETQETKYYLRLFQEDKEVALKIVDSNGYPVDEGWICTVGQNGVMYLSDLISADAARQAGIKLTKEGEIETRKEI